MSLLAPYLRLRTSLKLGIAFGMALGCLALVGIVSVFEFVEGTKRLTVVQSGGQDALAHLGSLRNQIKTYRLLVASSMLAADEAGAKAFTDKMPATAKQVAEDLAGLSEHVDTSKGKEHLTHLTRDWAEYLERADEWQTILQTQPLADAKAYALGVLSPIGSKKLDPSMDELVQEIGGEADRLAQDAQERATATSWLVGIVTVIAWLLAGLLALATARHIAKHVKTLHAQLRHIADHDADQLQRGMEAMASYDLRYSVQSSTTLLEVEVRDDLGEMALACNDLRNRFAEAIAAYGSARQNLSSLVDELGRQADSVKETSRSLADATVEAGRASTEIADGSGRLAHSAGEVAGITDRLQALSQNVNDAAASQQSLVSQAGRELDDALSLADQAAKASQEARAASMAGREKLAAIIEGNRAVQSSMEVSKVRVADLSASSQEIEAMIDAIQDIAAQTNLLALNAAIEAARAGEYGRGFAVVAEEVRSLAERAAQQAREISERVQRIQSAVQGTVESIEEVRPMVEAGSSLSADANEALEKITRLADGVAEQAVQVSSRVRGVAATVEQVREHAESARAHAAEVSHEVQTVAGSAQSVAATSEEAAASAQELSATNEEVGASADELRAMSERLQSVVSRFRLDTGEGLRRAA